MPVRFWDVSAPISPQSRIENHNPFPPRRIKYPDSPRPVVEDCICMWSIHGRKLGEYYWTLKYIYSLCRLHGEMV